MASVVQQFQCLAHLLGWAYKALSAGRRALVIYCIQMGCAGLERESGESYVVLCAALQIVNFQERKGHQDCGEAVTRET